LLEIFDQGKGDIAEKVPLVEFIEEDGSDFGESAVVLEPAEEDALGDKDDAGGVAGAVVEANLIADLSAEFHLPLRRDSGSHGTGRDASGLEDDDYLVSRKPGIEEHLWDLRGLARAGGGDEDETVSGFEGAEDVGLDFPDGKRGGSWHEVAGAGYDSARTMAKGDCLASVSES
jgi:hypothetical protein